MASTSKRDKPDFPKKIHRRTDEIEHNLRITLERLKISYCLDYLMWNQGIILREFLTEETRLKVLDLYGKVLHGIEPISQLDIKVETSKDLMRKGVPLYCDLIRILHENSELREFVHFLLPKIELDADEIELLECFEKFIDLVVEDSCGSSSEDDEEEKRQKAAKKEIKYNLEHIAEMEKEIIKKESLFEERFKRLDEQKEELLEKQKRLHDEFQEKIQRLNYESKKEQDEFIALSEAETKKMEEEIVLLHQKYQEILEVNLAKEKQLRQEKSKAETVLASVIAKYDNDIGELHRKLEIETAKYDARAAELAELQRRFDEQEIEYNRLMEEKKIEEEEIFQEKLYTFILNRSARRIQRWWRDILARKRARRKAKKQGKKGKK